MYIWHDMAEELRKSSSELTGCSDCACFTCSQRENCNNGCDGGGCTEEHEYFVSDCDDYESA